MRQTGKVALALLIAVSVAASLVSADTLEPFNQTELDTNWEADRAFPTGGVESVSAFGRDDVARLGINSSETAPGIFERTEGIKTVGDQNFGDFIEVDLYLDPAWNDTAVRAGFWVVGDDGNESTNGTDSRDNWFGIVEFVNNEPCSVDNCSNQANIQNHTGWRYWSSLDGWTTSNASFAYGEWVTIGIELDNASAQYNYYLDGTLIGTAPGGEHFMRELFLNSYNYGMDEFPTLSSESYAAHWHAGLEEPAAPTHMDDCKNGGWMDFTDPEFRNQGLCIAYVQANENARMPR